MLQFYVPMDFLEPGLLELIKADRLSYYFPRRHTQLMSLIQLVFRTALVLITGRWGLYMLVLHLVSFLKSCYGLEGQNNTSLQRQEVGTEIVF